jgi:hypothetical protein
MFGTFAMQPIGYGGGGSPISNPGVAYVMSDGDNSTGEIGNPAKPFLTAAAAVTAFGAVTSMSFVFGVGTFTANAILDALAANPSANCHITGQGSARTIVNMTWVGEQGEEGMSGEPGVVTDGLGGDGFDMTITSDHSADIRITATGGVGGTGGTNTGETGTGGGGGPGGSIGGTLRGVYGSLTGTPGTGGVEGGGPEGDGTPGADGGSATNTKFCQLTFGGLAAAASGVHMSILDGSAIVEV